MRSLRVGPEKRFSEEEKRNGAHRCHGGVIEGRRSKRFTTWNQVNGLLIRHENFLIRTIFFLTHLARNHVCV